MLVYYYYEVASFLFLPLELFTGSLLLINKWANYTEDNELEPEESLKRGLLVMI